MPGSNLVVTNNSRQIFTVGASAWTVRDIVDAALFRGEVEAVWRELVRRQACESRADDEERETDEETVDAAVQAFRYDHDLITAEETEQWLADRDLTLSDFGDYFSRQYWGAAMSDVRAGPVDLFSAPEELRDLLHAELVLSGELGRMAERLARRLAVTRETGEAAESEAIAAERAKFLARSRLSEDEVAGWLATLDRDGTWLEEMLHLEAAYVSQRERVLTPEALKRALIALRFQLTVFEVEIIEFDSREAAREALLCVREDGMAMEEVATEGRYPFRRTQWMLEDIAPEVQQQFLSVIPGRVLEPTEIEGGTYRLCRVLAKSEPDPEDAGVRKRVEQRVLDRHFADAVVHHVRWELWLS